MKNKKAILLFMFVCAGLMSCSQPEESTPSSVDTGAESAAGIAGGDPINNAQQNGLTKFEDVAPLDPANNCALDAINGKPADTVLTVLPGSELTLSGWASDNQNNVPTAVKVLLHSADAVFGIPAKMDFSRPDVAAMHKKSGAENYGFNSTARLDGVPVGEYQLEIAIQTGTAFTSCSFKRKLSVSP